MPPRCLFPVTGSASQKVAGAASFAGHFAGYPETADASPICRHVAVTVNSRTALADHVHNRRNWQKRLRRSTRWPEQEPIP